MSAGEQLTPMDRHERIPVEQIDVPRASERVHPAIRFGLAIVAIAVGCAAVVTSLMALLAGEVAPDAEGMAADTGEAWLMLLSGICWLLAGVCTWRESLTGTAIFFVLGLITGLMVTLA
jgi:hypothetical protein